LNEQQQQLTYLLACLPSFPVDLSALLPPSYLAGFVKKKLTANRTHYLLSVHALSDKSIAIPFLSSVLLPGYFRPALK
jgi:hypothetical protein